MSYSSLVEESIKRLLKEEPYNVSLYLDERGTAATDHLLVTGGALVYSDADEVSADWQHFSRLHEIENRKGTDLSREELLKASCFVVEQPLLPVAVWSRLCTEELERLQEFSRGYERSSSLEKRFEKISASSWLWKHQITQTIAYAEASFLSFIGPVGKAAVYIDKVTDQPGMREHYQELLEKSTSREHMRSVLAGDDTPQSVIKLLERASPKQWQINLNAKGPLARLADIVCAMFGRFMNDEIREPWEIVRLRYAAGVEKAIFPPCMGGDVTWSVRAWLEELYSRGMPRP